MAVRLRMTGLSLDLPCGQGIVSMWCHAYLPRFSAQYLQAVLGNLLLDETITGRWLVGACCLIAGQALIARATGGNRAQSPSLEAAKANVKSPQRSTGPLRMQLR